MPVPTKIRAIAEDPSAPLVDCYDSNDVATLAALAISKVFSNHKPTTTPKKEVTPMSLNPEYATVAKAPKRHIPGIGAGRCDRLVETLTRLGLCPGELAVPLKQLAAAGRPIKEFYTVDIDQLDRALNGVECSIEDRMRFKHSLHVAGILK
jgi:hypothetical protein